MKCPNCYITNEQDVIFCRVCGTRLINDDNLNREKTEQHCKSEPPKEFEVSKDGLPMVRTFEVNGLSFNMILVEGGTFWMGAQKDDPSAANYDPEAYPYTESPVHQEIVNTFYIGETPITMALLKAVLNNNIIEDRGYSHAKYENAPAFPLSLGDCDAFCSELMAQTGEFFRMPTEIEWEFAARGGTRSHGYRFSGSNILTKVGLYYYNNIHQSKTEFRIVKQKQPNELGLYDMSGLVYEWCQPGYDYMVCRGGCWHSAPSECRVSHRTLLSRSVGFNNVDTTYCPGLRLALTPKF